jgi:hypothetical protein
MFYSPSRNVSVLRLRRVIREKHVESPVGASVIEEVPRKSYSSSADKEALRLL